MARIKTRILSFDLPTDAVQYRVYYCEGGFVDYVDPYFEAVVLAGVYHYEVELPTMIPITSGTWTLGITAFDAEENESDMVTITHPFDFVAPNAPTNLMII
jgi:hypothetical protein